MHAKFMVFANAIVRIFLDFPQDIVLFTRRIHNTKWLSVPFANATRSDSLLYGPVKEARNLSEFLILPKAFVDYVATYNLLPLPPGSKLDTLCSTIELVCLEVSMDIAAKVDCGDCDSTPE
jgi:hypothetical protein